MRPFQPPRRDLRAAFTLSDVDEIGTAEAEITVGGHTFTIYNVHPDGSDIAMLTFARVLLERSGGKAYVIALGDYNLRDDEPAFQMIFLFLLLRHIIRWHKGLVGDGRADVTSLRLTRRQGDRFGCQVFERDHAEQVLDAVKPGAFLVIRINHVPGSLLDVGVGEHLIFCLGIFQPARPRVQIHGAEFPTSRRVIDPRLEA
jgi:hypothetical protein